MSPQHWLDAWSSGMLVTLGECKGLPTIVIDSATIISDIPGALTLLLSTLKAAGAPHAVIMFQLLHRVGDPRYCYNNYVNNWYLRNQSIPQIFS